jgi:hypothetical protein
MGRITRSDGMRLRWSYTIVLREKAGSAVQFESLEQGDRRDLGEVGLAAAVEPGVGQLLEQDVRFPVEDAMALVDDRDADRLGQVTLPGAAEDALADRAVVRLGTVGL